MKQILYGGTLLVAALLNVNCQSDMKTIKTLPYPVARMDSTVDDYFGTRVADPYRWMENDQAPETAAWVKAENEVTENYLSQIPYRGKIRERLTQLWNYPKYGIPRRVGEYLFFFENDGLQNQSVLYRQKGTDGEKEVFLDPNTLSENGTLALVDVSFSKDDRYMAYAAAVAGSDWVEIRVMETATGKTLEDRIQWVKFSGAEWSGDGFYYSAYDEPDQKTRLSAQNQFQKVYYHRLGTLQSEDRLIYEDPAHPLRYFTPEVSRDDRHLFITASEGTDGTEVLYRSTDDAKGRFKVLYPGFADNYYLVTCENGQAVFRTNHQAPNYELVVADLTGREPVTRTLVEEDSLRLLDGTTTAGGSLMLSYLDKAHSVVEQYDPEGRLIRSVELPGLGTVSGFSSEAGDSVTYYAYEGFTAPAAIYRYDTRDGASSLFKESSLPFDPEAYTSEQVTFNSKDGTPVTMFLVHRKDMKRNGKNPVYLYGYGGFNISRTPSFSAQNILLMEQGGIYALVNLRGGGEYGEQWHRAGMLDQKQNVFDDFIAAAEYLVAEGYTSSDKLGIAGGSNGGLLVGACMTQRPDLFAVALPAVGVMDMLRFHRFTVGWGWVVEYGCSENESDFPYLYAYSPLHNIRQGVCYPATLVTTADHDDRVVPAHSFKFTATLQAAQGCDRPTLIRIDTDAGHGAGKPTAKKIDEVTDLLSFFFWNTGTRVK